MLRAGPRRPRTAGGFGVKERDGRVPSRIACLSRQPRPQHPRRRPGDAGKAITLIESKRADHRAQAHRLVQDLLPLTGKAVRLGITGAPGAGKSTTIDALGTYLTGKGHKVAVLAVDPSSSRTGGSILGDKTRMAQLAARSERLHPALAFVRHARRRRRQDARDHAGMRGGGLRRGDGRDRRRRPVGNGRRRHDRFLPGADGGRRRRRIAGHQEGHRRTRRHDRRQQGRRRQHRARQYRGGRLPRRAAHPGAALADLVAAGGDLLRAHRQGHCRNCGARLSSTRRR